MTTYRRELTTVLYHVSRLNHTANGNPRFTLHTSDGAFTISSDSACSYDVENIASRLKDGRTLLVELALTRAGRFFGIAPVDGQ